MARAIDADYLMERLNKKKAGPANKRYTEGFNDCLMRVRSMVHSMPTLTPPNGWVSVEERLPEPGERVLATDCGFVGEFYINKRGQWQRYNVNCSELLMALDILYWMPLPEPPGKEG